MPTIAKATLGCQGLDIIEIVLGAFRGIPEFQPSQAGRVDNRATLHSREQLAMGCRMTAAAVVGADFLGRLRRRPSSWFVNVDLPTPDEPTRATVRLPWKYCSRSRAPS